MSQDGQGVGTEPIYIQWSIRGVDGGNVQFQPILGVLMRIAGKTYEAAVTSIAERLGREPLPHKRARATVVHGGDEAVDVIVDCQCRARSLEYLFLMFSLKPVKHMLTFEIK